MNQFLNFLTNVGLVWSFCVGVFCVGKHGYSVLIWCVNRAFDALLPAPPPES